MALFDAKPQYNMAGGQVQPQGGGFDYQSLLGNPLLHAGIGLLGSQKGQGAQAALQGLMQGQQYKQQFSEMNKNKAEEARLQQLSQSLPGLYADGGIGGVGQAMLGNPSTMSQGAGLLGRSLNPADNRTAQIKNAQYRQRLIGEGAPDADLSRFDASVARPFYGQMGDVAITAPSGSNVATPIMQAGSLPQTQADVQNTISQQLAEKAAMSDAAKQSIAMSGKSFEKLEPVGRSIAMLDDAESQLLSGAATGPIMSLLPSVTAASLALDNTQKQLGLNIIQNTTFGALSEKEMRLAMSTALPTGMKPPELLEWVKSKRAAQVKLQDYLEETATYLGTPGNTVAGFMAEKKNMATSNPAGSGIDINAIRAERARRQQARGQ
jgi:hypothetical protein